MDKMIRKADGVEIVNHWLLSGSCILLAITGFGFLFHVGAIQTFFGGAAAMRTFHNWAGVVFTASLAVSLFYYLPVSLVFTGEDAVWLINLGGYFSKKNTELPSQDKLNAAQKGFYLFLVLSGAAIAVTGFVLWLNTGAADARQTVLLSFLIHNISFVLMMLAVPTHIYLGSIANPGTLQIMLTGKVPVEWARKRHARWVQKQGV